MSSSSSSSSLSSELKSIDSMTIAELKAELQERGVEYSNSLGKKKDRLQALLQEVRSRPSSSTSSSAAAAAAAPAVPQQQKSSTNSTSSSSSSAIIDFEKEEVVLTEQDFRVFQEFCYLCSRTFKRDDDEDDEHLRCGQKCGACFCNRQCFMQFLNMHGLEHGKWCKATSTLRQLLKDVRTTDRPPSRAQCKLAVVEIDKINQLLSNNSNSNNNNASKHDSLMLRLLVCESGIVFRFVDFVPFFANSCAIALSRMSLCDRALLFGRLALSVAKRESGENSENFGDCLCNIASILTNQYRYDEARSLYERALSIFESTRRGKASVQYAQALNGLGCVLEATCKYDDAIEKLELSAKFHYALNGGESEAYAEALNNLANVLSVSNFHESALEYYEIVLKIMQKRFGDVHEKCAVSHHNIAICLLSLVRYDEARPHIERAIRIKERVFGASHLTVAQSLSLLGHFLNDRSQFDEALRVYERSLVIYRAAEDRHGIGAVLNSIGNVYSKQCRFDVALEKYRESLSISQALYGENHINTTASLRNVGNTLFSLDDFDGAIEYLQRALTIYEKIFDLDADHEGRVESKRILGIAKEAKAERMTRSSE